MSAMTVRKFVSILACFGRRFCAGCCWLFAPVATSVKGALDRNDFRPVIAKGILLAGAAGAGIKAAFRDPDVAGAAVVLGIAVLSGVLEAISRLSLGDATKSSVINRCATGPVSEGPSRDAEPRS